MVTAQTSSNTHSRSQSRVQSPKPVSPQIMHGPPLPPNMQFQKDFQNQNMPKPQPVNLPSPYVQNTFLSSFFKQPTQPVYIDHQLEMTTTNDQQQQQQQQQKQLPESGYNIAAEMMSRDGSGGASKRSSMSSVASVQEKLLKYKRDEDWRDLSLSPQKVTSVQLGKGRVKHVAKDIETQLPPDALPPAPRKKDPKSAALARTFSHSPPPGSPNIKTKFGQTNSGQNSGTSTPKLERSTTNVPAKLERSITNPVPISRAKTNIETRSGSPPASASVPRPDSASGSGSGATKVSVSTTPAPKPAVVLPLSGKVGGFFGGMWGRSSIIGTSTASHASPPPSAMNNGAESASNLFDIDNLID
ncbi:unnamed protein product [Ambrosiozyma monospora]|uniref:Unnamed protein product n=1 Tax=Ambrosiozyma monospora TaxID=43982 RepID=A0ACB5TSE4_AMBMO|nr:unnamed protein product [Ambrosiozyma monospora]